MKATLATRTLGYVLMLGASACWASDEPVETKPQPAETNAVPNAAAKTDTSGYKIADGPFEVATLKITLHDPKRAKDLEMVVRSPRAKAATGKPPGSLTKFPLIIFSHGMGGSSSAFTELSSHWASQGYVVIHPTHNDSLLLKRSKGEKIDMEAFRSKGTRGKVDPMDRHADIIFVLDSLDAVEEKVPALRVASGPEKDAPRIGIIDRERIGMSGHSAGAYTTQLIAGVKARGRRVGSPLALKSIGDSRIKASIVISGQGLTTASLGKESWNELDRPMLVISGSKDVSSVTDETPESRRHPFEYAKPGDKYLIFIEGATHSSYAGKARVSALLGEGEPTDIKMIGGVTSAGTTAFWDAFLKNDAAAKKYLAGDELVKFSRDKAELKRK